MEKRIGGIIILIENDESVPKLNALLTSHRTIILGRQGLPLSDRSVKVISLVVEGTTDDIGSLTGSIGRLNGVQVKSVLTKYKGEQI